MAFPNFRRLAYAKGIIKMDAMPEAMLIGIQRQAKNPVLRAIETSFLLYLHQRGK
jgi:hypothetical protein